MNYTIQQVAERTGLSTATISRILNGKGAHSEETILRVKRVISEFEGRSSLSRMRECVGIVMLAYPGFLCGTYTPPMLSAILETFAEENIVAQIIPVSGSRLTLEEMEHLIGKFQLRGILVQELAGIDQVTEPLDKLSVPVVRIGEVRHANEVCASVRSDNKRVGINAAAYLWNLGFRKFGTIYTGNSDYGQEQRVQAFLQQIREFGGDEKTIWKKEIQHTALESAIQACEEFRSAEPRPQAIFLAQGGLTQMFLVQAKRAGFHIPEDLFLLAVEDHDELTLADLPIATISFPTRNLGAAAAAMLVEQIRTPGIPKRNLEIAGDLRVRVGASCLSLLQEKNIKENRK